MFQSLLFVFLEVVFWCFLFLTVIDIGTADAKRVVRHNDIEKGNRCVHHTVPVTSVKKAKNVKKGDRSKQSRIPIRKAGPDTARSTMTTSSDRQKIPNSAVTPVKRFVLAKRLHKLKYSDDLRKVCFYNQIIKKFSVK